MTIIAQQFYDEWDDNNTSNMYPIMNAIERIEERLSALEHSEQPVMRPPGCEHWATPVQAKDSREWMKLSGEFWVYFPDGDINNGELGNFIGGFTHIMPYHPGDPAPEPPKEVSHE